MKKEQVKIPIKKLTAQDPERLTNLANLPRSKLKLFDYLSQSPQQFYQGCSNMGQNAVKKQISWKKLSGKIGAISIFNKKKNPTLANKARLCQEIANYEGYNITSPEIKELQQQKNSKSEIQQKLLKKVEKIL